MANFLPRSHVLCLLLQFFGSVSSPAAALSSVSSASSSSAGRSGSGALRVLVPLRVGFEQFVSWENVTSHAPNATPAYKFNGFSVQVFLQALARLPHPPSFDFVPVGDGKSTPSYNAMVDQVQRGEADAIVADLTITRARMNKVDFTMPYIESALVMVTTFKYGSAGTMWDFLHPFSWQLWLALAIAFASTGFMLYFLERNNPEFSKHAPSLVKHPVVSIHQEGDEQKTNEMAAFSSNKSHEETFPHSTSPADQGNRVGLGCNKEDCDHRIGSPTQVSMQNASTSAEEIAFQPPVSGVSPKHLLLNAYWFTSLCVFAAQQESVKTHTGRIVTVVWLFTMLIFNSSYTASLASLLSAQQPYPRIQSFGALLKSNAAVGYLEGSFVEAYLERLGFASNRLHKYHSEFDFAQALKNSTNKGGVAAILDEAPYTTILLQSECDFTSVGDQIAYFGGFGFAFAKNSSLTDEVSKGILGLAEDGVLQRLRNGFLQGAGGGQCSSSDGSSRLSFRSFVGLFSVLGAVYAACVVWRVFSNALRRTNQTPSGLSRKCSRQNSRVAVEPQITQDPVHTQTTSKSTREPVPSVVACKEGSC